VSDAAQPAGSGVPASLLALPGRLRRARSGVAFVYEALESLAEQFRLADAVLVVDGTAIGRQIFRLGRRPLGAATDGLAARGARSLLDSPAGIYTTPPGVVDEPTSAYLTDLVAAALELDLLAHDAGHDPLTGLLNRRAYELALAEAVARGRRYGWPFALVMVDLDDFKAVNDLYGHAAGDAALRVIGTEIRGLLRRGDVAARIGGDEFALIISNAASPEALEPLVERLRPRLAVALPDTEVGFSAGVACFPTDTDDPVRLQALADERLYTDKAQP
jgi:diguanylate cyclase (GGDEF)-like protein